MDKKIKNAIIINGKTYVVKRATYVPFMDVMCKKCDLQRRCDASRACLCIPFEKNGFVPYFKKFKD